MYKKSISIEHIDSELNKSASNEEIIGKESRGTNLNKNSLA